MPGAGRGLHLILNRARWSDRRSIAGRLLVNYELVSVEAGDHGVEGKRAEEVAAHALLHLDEGAGGGVDPVYAETLSEPAEFGFEVDVADELGRSGDDEEQIFNEAARGAE